MPLIGFPSVHDLIPVIRKERIMELIGFFLLGGSRGRTVRRPRNRFRPGVAALEGRTLLSTWTVTNLNDSGDGSLRAQVGNAQDGDTVNFARGLTGTITLSSGVIHVPAAISIVGPGAGAISVSGGGNSGVFEFDSPFGEPPITINVSGLTITGGDPLDPAALNFGATLTLDRVTLSGNQGGALSNDFGILNLQHSSVSDNTIGSPDAGLTLTAGLFNVGTANISDSEFSNNVSQAGGTAVGGAILSAGGETLNVTRTLFQDNQVQGGFGGAFGGAIHVDVGGFATISDSQFLGNQAISTGQSSGGAIDFNGASLSVTNSLFSGNVVGGSGSGTGGAINNSGTATITNTAFQGNQAVGSEGAGFELGGGICNVGFSANLTVTNGRFSGNLAQTGATTGFAGFATGGAIVNQFGATATINGSRFQGNQAIGADASGAGNQGANALGGAIENIFNSTLTITGSDFLRNQAIGGSGTNGATGGPARGGAIDNESGSTLNVFGSRLTNNLAQGGDGGGDGFGGGLYNDGSNASFVDTMFTANRAIGGNGGGQGVGGGLYINSGSVSLTGKTKAVGNHASTADDNIHGSYTS
jgi:hypothetical protein